MLEFIIEMPPEGCSHARGHTMPFVANEIFNCEMASITSKFFTPAIAYTSKEFSEFQMTPLSSFKSSDDQFEPSKFPKGPEKKADLEIIFDDEDVEM